jgi:hypothetical protein
VSDKQGILTKKYGELRTIKEDLGNIAKPLANADTIYGWKVDPPAEIYHHFDRYLVNHYEQLKEIVHHLYNEKSDFEFAVVLHDSFSTEEEARDYILQHNNEFRTDVFTVQSGAVSLIGPFKENRARVDFYNKNTEIMKRMHEQLELDHKLGSDLINKTVSKKKRKNILEAGPDDPGLAAYASAINQMGSLGVKKVLSKEEVAQLEDAKEKARKIREEYEIPDDAINVDIFYPKENSDGTIAVGKTNFYTQAEAPTFLQDKTRLNEPYQPTRSKEKSTKTAHTTKVITSRDGTKKEIKVVKE